MVIDPRKEPRLEQLMKEEFQRSLMSLPRDVLRAQLLKTPPGPNGVSLEELLRYIEQRKERDPLAVLQEESLVGGEKGGQFNLMKLAPNFEMAMYLAQATGSCIVTDAPFAGARSGEPSADRLEDHIPVWLPSRETSRPPHLRSLRMLQTSRCSIPIGASPPTRR